MPAARHPQKWRAGCFLGGGGSALGWLPELPCGGALGLCREAHLASLSLSLRLCRTGMPWGHRAGCKSVGSPTKYTAVMLSSQAARLLRPYSRGPAWARASASSVVCQSYKMKRKGDTSPLPHLPCTASCQFLLVSHFKTSSFPDLPWPLAPATASCLHFPLLHPASQTRGAGGQGATGPGVSAPSCGGQRGRAAREPSTGTAGPCWLHCWTLSSQGGLGGPGEAPRCPSGCSGIGPSAPCNERQS